MHTFGDALPEELVGALGTLPGEEASPADLERVLLGVRASVAAVAPGTAVPETHVVVGARRHRRVLFRGTLALVKTFAVGAGAGVLVVSAVHFVPQLGGGDAPRAPSSVAVPESAPPSRALSRAREHSADLAPPVEVTPAPARVIAVSPSVRPSAVPAASATASDELQLLARAQAALDTDPGRALALTSDHERRFPRGALAQEREVIAIDALLRLGRRGEASARGARFRRLYPTSVHERRIDVLLNPPAP